MPDPITAAVVGTVGTQVVGSYLSRKDRKRERQANAAATSAAQSQQQIAEERYQHWKDNFQQLEVDLAKEVQGGPDYASREATAVADYSQSANLARQSEQRRQRSYGIDPSSGRALQRMRQSAIQESAGRAGIINRTRVDERDRHFAKKQSVANMGRDIPGQAVNAYGQAGQAQRAMSAIYQQRAANTQQMVGNISGMMDWSKMLSGGSLKSLGGGGGGGGSWNQNPGQYGQSAPGFADGGEVNGPGGPMDDSIPINVSDGEYVIPERVVRAKGTEFFDKLLASVDEQGGSTNGV